jgi:phage shock protein PspC (stress-responsive transcriptional regulator)
MAVNARATSPHQLRRSRRHKLIAGVCAGLGRRLGIDPIIIRVAFVAAAVSGGIGVALYLVAWALMPLEGSDETMVDRVRSGRASWETALGAGLLVLSALLVFRELGMWFSDAIVWPVVLAAAGAAVIWRQSATSPARAAPPAAEGSPQVVSVSGRSVPPTPTCRWRLQDHGGSTWRRHRGRIPAVERVSTSDATRPETARGKRGLVEANRPGCAVNGCPFRWRPASLA